MIAGMMIMYLNHIFFIYVLYLIYYTQITVAYNSGTDCIYCLIYINCRLNSAAN